MAAIFNSMDKMDRLNLKKDHYAEENLLWSQNAKNDGEKTENDYILCKM